MGYIIQLYRMQIKPLLPLGANIAPSGNSACVQMDQPAPHLLANCTLPVPSSAAIAANIAAGAETMKVTGTEVLSRMTLQEEVSELRCRLTAAETEAARHVQIITAMHAWASKTAGTLRQLQSKCQAAEARASAAEHGVTELGKVLQQMSRGQQQLEAIVNDLVLHTPNNGLPPKRRRVQGLRRVATADSLTDEHR